MKITVEKELSPSSKKCVVSFFKGDIANNNREKEKEREREAIEWTRWVVYIIVYLSQTMLAGCNQPGLSVQLLLLSGGQGLQFAGRRLASHFSQRIFFSSLDNLW